MTCDAPGRASRHVRGSVGTSSSFRSGVVNSLWLALPTMYNVVGAASSEQDISTTEENAQLASCLRTSRAHRPENPVEC